MRLQLDLPADGSVLLLPRAALTHGGACGHGALRVGLAERLGRRAMAVAVLVVVMVVAVGAVGSDWI